MSGSPAEHLREKFGMKGILTSSRELGGIDDLLCDMNECYCPHGRGHFEPISVPLKHWIPSEDHHPKLKKDGGQRVPGNVRLAHRLCNNLDYALNALPEEKRDAAIARWRRKYSEESPVSADARAVAQARWEARRAEAQLEKEAPSPRAT